MRCSMVVRRIKQLLHKGNRAPVKSGNFPNLLEILRTSPRSPQVRYWTIVPGEVE
jgi:hypothetical protein